MSFLQYIRDFIALFFPEGCLGCKRILLSQEEFICEHCYYNLPFTFFHLEKENQAAKKMWGRVPFETVVSCFYFTYGSNIQRILHSIKYHNKPQVAQYLGKLYGCELLDSGLFNDAALILPVPLHKKRLTQRGYNQSEYFAKGLSEGMGIEVETKALKRAIYSQSQTKKNRYERFNNTKGTFAIEKSHEIANRHIILIDDVLTTGATLEACANVLLKVKGVRISMVTLAFAK